MGDYGLSGQRMSPKDDPIVDTAVGTIQPGGRQCALQVLESFLGHRAARYRGTLSKPKPAQKYCSRL